jgi:DNA polymerase III sliding clamp (beta) subunit (PCNA family)
MSEPDQDILDREAIEQRNALFEKRGLPVDAFVPYCQGYIDGSTIAAQEIEAGSRRAAEQIRKEAVREYATKMQTQLKGGRFHSFQSAFSEMFPGEEL